MKISIGISHPKHVYMFKNIINEMSNKGHEFYLYVFSKDITVYLLDELKLKYHLIGDNSPIMFKKILNSFKGEYKTLLLSKIYKPDIYLGQALPNIAHISAIYKKPYIIFEDSEPASILQFLSFPFAKSIITPINYRLNHGYKHIKINSYFELGYLHPKYFKPKIEVYDKYNLNKNDPFYIVRFVSWSAIHDIGKEFQLKYKRKIVQKLKKHGEVFITSEKVLPKDLEKYRKTIPMNDFHSLLHFSDLYIGDSGTMATEAALLGTPTIRISPFVGINDMGNFIELEKKYGIIYNYNNINSALNKIDDLINNHDVKKEWLLKRDILLKEKIDFTNYAIKYLENFNHEA